MNAASNLKPFNPVMSVDVFTATIESGKLTCGVCVSSAVSSFLQELNTIESARRGSMMYFMRAIL